MFACADSFFDLQNLVYFLNKTSANKIHSINGFLRFCGSQQKISPTLWSVQTGVAQPAQNAVQIFSKLWDDLARGYQIILTLTLSAKVRVATNVMPDDFRISRTKSLKSADCRILCIDSKRNWLHQPKVTKLESRIFFCVLSTRGLILRLLKNPRNPLFAVRVSFFNKLASSGSGEKLKRSSSTFGNFLSTHSVRTNSEKFAWRTSE